MMINTAMYPIKKLTKKEEATYEKQTKKFAYSKKIGEIDSKEMSVLRKQLLHAIEQNKPNVDELIYEFEQLKEKEFIEKHGMSYEDYNLKLEQELYERETVAIRTCICRGCHSVFESDRLYPDCPNCNYTRQDAIEKIEDSSLLGKEIKEVYTGPYNTILIFTDNTFKNFTEYSYDE